MRSTLSLPVFATAFGELLVTRTNDSLLGVRADGIVYEHVERFAHTHGNGVRTGFDAAAIEQHGHHREAVFLTQIERPRPVAQEGRGIGTIGRHAEPEPHAVETDASRPAKFAVHDFGIERSPHLVGVGGVGSHVVHAAQFAPMDGSGFNTAFRGRQRSDEGGKKTEQVERNLAKSSSLAHARQSPIDRGRGQLFSSNLTGSR